MAGLTFRYLWLFAVCWIRHSYVSGNVCEEDTMSGTPSLLLNADSVDIAPGSAILMTDTDYVFDCCGRVKKWIVVAKGPGSLAIGVWRAEGATGAYTMAYRHVYVLPSGKRKHELDVEGDTFVEFGDVIGWATTGPARIFYSEAAIGDSLHLEEISRSVRRSFFSKFFTSVHQRNVDWSTVRVEGNKRYTIRAKSWTQIPGLNGTIKLNVLQVNPYQKLRTFLTDRSDRSDPFGEIHPGRSDPYSAYFEIFTNIRNVEDAFQVELTLNVAGTIPPPGVYNLGLIFRVACGISRFRITIDASLEGIRPLLQTFDDKLVQTYFAYEGETEDRLVSTIMVRTDTYFVCFVNSTLPPSNIFFTKELEGNYSLATYYTDQKMAYGLYVIGGSGLNKTETPDHLVRIRCTDAVGESVNLVYNVVTLGQDLPKMPDYPWIIVAPSNVTRNDVIQEYRAYGSYYVELVECDDSPCPFGIKIQTGKSMAVIISDVSQHVWQRNLYSLTYVLSDGFVHLPIKTIRVSIDDPDLQPIITNLPQKISSSAGNSVVIALPEDTQIGSVVFQATYLYKQTIRAVPRYIEQYTPDIAADYLRIDREVGSLKLIRNLNYEPLRERNETTWLVELSLQLGDRQSPSGFLWINITDVLEPPYFKESIYCISTEEPQAGDILPNLGITLMVEDIRTVVPQYSISCGPDDGYIQANTSSGELMMTQSFDLDETQSGEHVIDCVMTVQDDVGLEATTHVLITILDANDGLQKFLSEEYNFCVSTPLLTGAYVGQVKAIDTDSSEKYRVIQYELSKASFVIDDYGDIYLKDTTTFEKELDISGHFHMYVYTVDGQNNDENRVPVRVDQCDLKTILTLEERLTSRTNVTLFSISGILFILACLQVTCIFISCCYKRSPQAAITGNSAVPTESPSQSQKI